MEQIYASVLVFDGVEPPAVAGTKRFEASKLDHSPVGWVYWSRETDRYVFEPNPMARFSANALNQTRLLLDMLNREIKQR